MSQHVAYIEQRVTWADLLKVDESQLAFGRNEHLIVVEVIMGQCGRSPCICERPKDFCHLLQQPTGFVVL